jgi:hypothetical protein
MSTPRLFPNCVWVSTYLWPVSLFALGGITAAYAQDSEKIKPPASWQRPSALAYENLLESFLEQKQASPTTRAAVSKAWKEATNFRGPELLDRLLDVSSLVEPRLAELVSQLRSVEGTLTAPKDIPWLTSDIPGWLQDSVRLACGRAFAQRRMYDEALESLAGLELGQVCDPESLLFYRAGAEHHLLKKAECLANLKLLMEREDELPVRYRQIAQLMQTDIAPLKEDSLDEIARIMTDVQRRLDLGRAGQRVRDEEETIVKKLDKLIDEVEKQAQKMNQPNSAGGEGQKAPSGAEKPLDESRVAGGPKGAGDVDPKKLEQRFDWGNLPPAQRQEALQRLTEELPTHYRDVIEGYFRQLAKDKN